MSVRIGLYDFFAYTIPGVFYLLIVGYAAMVFGLLPIDWNTVNNLSLTALVILAGAGYVTGVLMDFFALWWSRLFRSRNTAKTALQNFQSRRPWAEVNFVAGDWGLLMAGLRLSANDASQHIEHLNVTSLMMRNISLGLALLAGVFTLYYFSVYPGIWNAILAIACLGLSVVAGRVSKTLREWFYLGVYEAAAVQQLTDTRWFTDRRLATTESDNSAQNKPDHSPQSAHGADS